MNLVNAPLGKGVGAKNLETVNYGEFAIIDMGSIYESEFNENLKSQIEDAKKQGVPVIGVYKVYPEFYVTRSEGIEYELWNPETDWLIVGKDIERFYMDRFVRDGIDAIMLDICIYEGGENNRTVIKPSWYIAVAKYYIKLVSERYNMPSYFLFLRNSHYELLKAKQENGEVDLFLKNLVGSICGVKFGDYLNDTLSPLTDGTSIDFWYYGQEKDENNENVSNWVYCNGDLDSLRSMLNYTGQPSEEPDEDEEPVEEPIEEDELIDEEEDGDSGLNISGKQADEMIKQLKLVKKYLKYLCEHLGAMPE